MSNYSIGMLGCVCAAVLSTAASAQISIIAVNRSTYAAECFNVPPDHLNICDSDSDSNQASGVWTGTGSFGNGAAADDFNYANGTAQVFQNSEITSSKLTASAQTSTWAGTAGSGSVQVNANTAFAVQFEILAATRVLIDANFVTSGGSGSAALTRVGGGTHFATAGAATADLILAPGQYHFIASSVSSGSCGGACGSQQACTWDATLTFDAAPCRADFNGDDFLDFTDFDDFVVAFEGGQSNADFNGDGFLDFTDFDDFVVSFEAGC